MLSKSTKPMDGIIEQVSRHFENSSDKEKGNMIPQMLMMRVSSEGAQHIPARQFVDNDPEPENVMFGNSKLYILGVEIGYREFISNQYGRSIRGGIIY